MDWRCGFFRWWTRFDPRESHALWVIHPIARETSAHHITDEEFQQRANFTEMGMAGLGFAHVPQPLAYRFYGDETGEDIHFWWDHPDLGLHWAKDVHLGDRKTMVMV